MALAGSGYSLRHISSAVAVVGMLFTSGVRSPRADALLRADAQDALTGGALAILTGDLPVDQANADIGSPLVPGATSYQAGTYRVTGGGTDIWDTADQFHFVYQQVNGDVDITTRVASIQSTVGSAKAGVMIRESLAPDARNAFARFTKSTGSAFQRRIDSGGFTVATAAGSGKAPGWLRLVRRGYQFSAFWSIDGQTWEAMGTDTVPMQDAVYVGLAVTGDSTVKSARVTFDNLSIVEISAGPNQPPLVTMTSPGSGAVFSAPATITVAANASDPEQHLAQVEFFNGSTSLGRATAPPYAVTWSSIPAGTYTLMAVASDADGANATSTPVTIEVRTSSPQAAAASTTVVFRQSPDHTTGVGSYVLEVFADGADPSTAAPIASSDLGKPAPDGNGDIAVDSTTFFNGLASGAYTVTVSAIGPSAESGRSAPVSFVK